MRSLGSVVATAIEACREHRAPTDDDEIDGHNRHYRVRACLETFAGAHDDVGFKRHAGEAFELSVAGHRVLVLRQDGSIPGGDRRSAPVGQLSLFGKGSEGPIVIDYGLTPDGACRRVTAHLLDRDSLGELDAWEIWTPAITRSKQASSSAATALTRDEQPPVDDFPPRMLQKPGDGESKPD